MMAVVVLKCCRVQMRCELGSSALFDRPARSVKPLVVAVLLACLRLFRPVACLCERFRLLSAALNCC